jgi:cellulose synthase/poly-beta-1,6-N-acetylglucosamine synthase-like glycosyltransferase
MEVLVIDGMSSDRTGDIVAAYAAQDPRIRLLSNPRRRTPFSMNIGVAAARGSIVVRIDGHSVVPGDHVWRCVQALLESGAEHIGGRMHVRGRGHVASTIALALSSPIGVGNARFRYTQREQDTDTVPFGAYYRETLLRLGGFDERFLIGQDSELDFRIILSGGRVHIDPCISTVYYCRDSLSRLAQQFFRYGRGKALILHKHHRLPSYRALMPAILVSCISVLALGSLISHAARRTLAAVLTWYAFACTLAAFIVAVRRGLRYLPLLPVTFMVLHLSHGLGFLSGLPRLLTPRPRERLRGSLVLPRDMPAGNEAYPL